MKGLSENIQHILKLEHLNRVLFVAERIIAGKHISALQLLAPPPAVHPLSKRSSSRACYDCGFVSLLAVDCSTKTEKIVLVAYVTDDHPESNEDNATDHQHVAGLAMRTSIIPPDEGNEEA